MPCLPNPNLPGALPTLPSGISLTPTAGALPAFAGQYCCTLPPFPTPGLPAFLGATMALPPVVATIRALLGQIRTVLDAAIIVCPRE